MFVPLLISWWYGPGWLKLMTRVGGRVQGVLNFFSVGLLAGSLFAPFRQISAGRVQGPLGVQLSAWFDRQFSRVIGAIVRMLLILAGLLLAAITGLVGLLLVVAWPLIPLAPIIGFMLMSGGLNAG
ncbi:MAG: hypothetical protein ACREGJ_03340 [Candidatus Saccharimonadales bacterium]